MMLPTYQDNPDIRERLDLPQDGELPNPRFEGMPRNDLVAFLAGSRYLAIPGLR
jgi:hypothetical protein